MSEHSALKALSERDRVLVAIAVLIDGREAETYLENDAVNSKALTRAAEHVAAQPPELRMPLLGTTIRSAIKQLSKDQG